MTVGELKTQTACSDVIELVPGSTYIIQVPYDTNMVQVKLMLETMQKLGIAGIVCPSNIKFFHIKPEIVKSCPCGKPHCGKLINDTNMRCQLEVCHFGRCGIHPIS